MSVTVHLYIYYHHILPPSLPPFTYLPKAGTRKGMKRRRTARQDCRSGVC